MVLRLLREQGVSNPTALDAGALVDAEVFTIGTEPAAISEISTRIGSKLCTHRAGLECLQPPLDADDYLFLRHALVEVYHWLIIKQKL
jgi:hypothetical protein